jgi:hypothetical protein
MEDNMDIARLEEKLEKVEYLWRQHQAQIGRHSGHRAGDTGV